MSYLQVTAFQPSSVSNQYKRVNGSVGQCIARVNIFDLHKYSLKPTIGSLKKCTELSYLRQRTGTSQYQQCTPVCLFGGKGESKNGDEGSPWKSLEKAMSSFKKEQSLEDVLKQQMEKQEYYDGGTGDNPPGGGGGGGGGGFGGTEDEGFAGIWDDIVQFTLAVIGLVALYVYIIARERVNLFLADSFEFLSGKRGPRMRTIMYVLAQFFQKFRCRVRYDPYWLEKAIIATPTYYDSPRKYRRMLRAYRHKSSRKAIDADTDTDDKAYNEDSDDNKPYNNNKNAYNEDNDDDDAYSEDVDDDY